jgi:hypothetical protein
MATSVADKLKIKPGFTLLTINEPSGFQRSIVGLPANVKVVESGKVYDQIHWFVMNRAQVEKEMSKVMKLLKPGVLVWIYYPKGSSGLQTDLTRDKGWNCLLAESDKLTWISLISFDNTWSTFGMRSKTEADKKKDTQSKPKREIFKWVNPKTKTVKLPDDLALLLKKNKKQADFFNVLSFTNKKEYIEWIVTAKQKETRIERLKGTMERLNKGWKNPRNI